MTPSTEIKNRIMKTRILQNLGVSVLLMLTILAVHAQPPDGGPKGDRIQALRIAYISKELNLTPDEAKVFWPIYDQRDAELKALRRDRRDEIEDIKENFETMSDAEVDKAVTEMFSIQQKEVEINQRYYAEFKKVIPMRKAALLFRCERQFRNILLREMQEHRPGGPPGGRPGGGPGSAPGGNK